MTEDEHRVLVCLDCWEQYFEKRLSKKMVANLKGKRQLIQPWKEQQDV